MLKSLRTIVSIIAVANLLALAGFVVWLKTADRLSADRLRQVQQVFTETLAQQKEREADEEREKERQAKAADEARRAAMAPLPAEDAVRLQKEREEIDGQRVARLRREVEDLKRSLRRERAELDAKIAAFDAERNAFEKVRKSIVEEEGGEQFKKTVGLYESLPPAKSQAMLQSLLDKGLTEQVVAYLYAMQSRAAKKIIDKFSDPAVAADLLERLRTRGLEARAPEGS